ncbi:ABC transporter substrate-binding protein [Prescottella defluvii]|uniref:ABC transporter substrate-binding protein n=1 Tax=Prescottella defluvii TaxID=1323361 RepID=UPI000691B4B0|nr:ABC transporter substrate-binding protein [Prescottella defluvii]
MPFFAHLPARSRYRRLLTALCAAGLATTVTACGQAVSGETASASGEAAYVDAANCGITTQHDRTPSKAVTLTSNATETMLELGLEDRMVGTAYLRGREIAPDYAAAYAEVPILSSEQPTMEQLIDVAPDFVYSGYPDGFSEKNGHTREQLAQVDVKTHLNPEGCAQGPVEIEDIFAEITTIGGIFRVPERAATSVAALRARLDTVRDRVGGEQPIKVFLYASGTDKASTTGGNSMATALIEAAGGTNVFADVPERWMSVSWEQVAERAPDVILVREEGTTPQYQSPSVAQKIADLNGVPVIAATPAVRDQAFATITLSQLQPGPYSIDGVEHLARQFHPTAFE